MAEGPVGYDAGDAARAALNLGEAIMRGLNWDTPKKRQIVEAAIDQMDGYPSAQTVLRDLFSPLWDT